MGSVIDKVANIGSTSDADRARTANTLAAQAAGKSAEAQEEQLRKSVGFAQTGLNRTMSYIDQIDSPEALRALNQSISTQEKELGRQSELFASIDPAVMEASKQALQLLQGEDAKSLEPIRADRQRQRQKLLNNLREQLGPGAETSSAGIQALNQFDQQTSSLLSGAQQSSMAQLFGMAGQGAANRSAMNQGTQVLGGLGSSLGSLVGQQAGQKASMSQGAYGQLINAQSGLAAGAGSQFVGAQLQAQGEKAQAQNAYAANAAIGGQILGGLMGPALGTAGTGISNAMFGADATAAAK